MSYNLLLDTGFNHINKHWKLTNCSYENGYLKGTAKVYSIEQEIVLPDPTRLYFSIEYIAKNKDIKHVYAGIQTGDILEATKKFTHFNKRTRLSVVDKIKCEKVKVIFIVEAKTETSSIYIDSPLLVDLIANNKNYWPKSILNTILDYRQGYLYENIYKESELTINNRDFSSVNTPTKPAKQGLLAEVISDDWFHIQCPIKADTYYLVKLDYQELNQYGDLYLKYGNQVSIKIKDQLYILFKGNSTERLLLYVENSEVLPYMLNLKHLLVINLTNTELTEDDIMHLPFV